MLWWGSLWNIETEYCKINLISVRIRSHSSHQWIELVIIQAKLDPCLDYCCCRVIGNEVSCLILRLDAYTYNWYYYKRVQTQQSRRVTFTGCVNRAHPTPTPPFPYRYSFTACAFYPAPKFHAYPAADKVINNSDIYTTKYSNRAFSYMFKSKH